jgi:hypothetical protein
MIYAHQHNIIKASGSYGVSKNSTRQTITEKCSLCDAMHSNAMVKATTANFGTIASLIHIFKRFNYSFTSIQLILSGGRAPPAAHISA